MLTIVFADDTAAAGKSSHELLVERWLGGTLPSDVHNKCGLPAITEALLHRDKLNPAEATALANVLQRPSTHKNIVVGNFRIHYDTTGVNEPALLNAAHSRIPGTANGFADSVGAIANYVLRFQRDSLGYLPPPSDNGAGGGNEYDIYIQSLGGSYYGLTTPESPINNKPEGGTFTTYMLIDNDFSFVFPDSNKGLPALRVTLAHELHHAIQIGSYGYWSSDIYFYEITSVWMEDAVFPNVNDYFQYLSSSLGHFRRPDVSFTSNEFVMYSRGIWCHYLAKKFGRNAIRKCWEEVSTARPLTAMDAALSKPPYLVSIRNAFIEWSIWNYFTAERADTVAYYPEGRFYPSIVKSVVDFTPPSRVVSGNVNPFGSRYYDVSSSTQNLKLLVSNVNSTLALSGNASSLSYSLSLNSENIGGQYNATSAGIFVKIDVSDPSNWYSKDLFGVSGTVGPFPNPFYVNGSTVLQFPVSSPNATDGTLSIYSTSMDLIYSQRQTSILDLGKEVFKWNGRNDNHNIVGSGIYFYVLETVAGTTTGKIAVIRK